MKEPPLVSYLVPVYNMEETIGKTIESLLNQDYPNKEIIVINDGSVDNTEEILKKYPIKYITTENKGISHAKNIGYKNSKGEFIAFTDADCELDKSWTKNILKGFTDENVGLVGGITEVKIDGSYCSIYRSLEFSRRYRNVKNPEVVWAPGSCSMFRRTVLDDIGGFNPEWTFGEDAQISFMTFDYGYKIVKQNDAIGYHAPQNTYREILKKSLRNGKGYVLATKSHPKVSLHNKFNLKWYFPYDLLLLPILYAFIIISAIFFPILYLLNLIIDLPFLFDFILFLWRWAIIFIGIFLLIYGLIPSFEVALNSKNKKIKAFFGTTLLHHIRGLAWGIGLMLGIINIITRKK